MKAIKVVDGAARLVDAPEPTGDGVKLRVHSASICGSDLHMMSMGFLGDATLGHEFAGVTPDGRAVAVEPTVGCGSCFFCDQGDRHHCDKGFNLMGVLGDGGMAEYVMVPPENLVELPGGVSVANACLVEPLAVAVHGLDRARAREGERILVIGGGPIGLAAAAALRHRGMAFDIAARYPHQQQVADQLGAGPVPGEGYDLVIDAVGSEASLREAVQRLRPCGRIGLLGSFWEPTALDALYCMKEIELLPAATYRCKAPQRNFSEAAQMLQAAPELADLLITHRYPLDAVDEAFAAAADRSAGAIKVAFDIAA